MNALAAAGFDLKMADTPAKLERIKKLPQLRLAQVEHKGRQVYVYTDAQGCQCLYAGDEIAYRRLINQARQQKIDQRSGWAQDQSNQSTYYYRGEPINSGDVIMITGSDIDLEDLKGGGTDTPRLTGCSKRRLRPASRFAWVPAGQSLPPTFYASSPTRSSTAPRIAPLRMSSRMAAMSAARKRSVSRWGMMRRMAW